jgi:hypothetical protein
MLSRAVINTYKCAISRVLRNCSKSLSAVLHGYESLSIYRRQELQVGKIIHKDRNKLGIPAVIEDGNCYASPAYRAVAFPFVCNLIDEMW